MRSQPRTRRAALTALACLVSALAAGPLAWAQAPGLGGLARLSDRTQCAARVPGVIRDQCYSLGLWRRSLTWELEGCPRERRSQHTRLERVRAQARPSEVVLAESCASVRRERVSLLTRTRVALEGRRLWLAERWAPSDRWGALRKLVLNWDTRSGPDSPPLRALGFVHILTAAGMHLMWLALGVLTGVVWWLERWGWRNARSRYRVALALAGGVWAWVWCLAGLRPGMLRPLLLVAWRQSALRLGFSPALAAPLTSALVLDLSVGAVRAWGSSETIGQWAPGRLHYALAVGGALWAWRWSERLAALGPLARLLWISLGSWLVPAVWDAAMSGWVSFATPVVNLVSFPLLGAVVFPLSVGLAALGPEGGAPVEVALEAVATLYFEALQTLVRLLLAWAVAAGESPLAPYWVVGRREWLLGAMGVTLLAATLEAVRQRRAPIRAVRAVGWEAPAVLTLPSVVLALVIATARGAAERELGGVSPRPDVQAHRIGERAMQQRIESVEQAVVGQGDRTWIKSTRAVSGAGSLWRRQLRAVLARALPPEVGLIDVGAAWSATPEQWLLQLAARGAARVDWVALTHGDQDHQGALASLQPWVRIQCAIADPTEPRYPARIGERWVAPEWAQACSPLVGVGGVGGEGASSSRARGNARMAGFVLDSPALLYVNLGDADRTQERAAWAALQARGVDTKPSTKRQERILKVSHHGSRFSSDESWVRKLAPTRLWVSAGEGNRYGHPSAETLARLHRAAPLARLERTEGRDLGASGPSWRAREAAHTSPGAIINQKD